MLLSGGLMFGAVFMATDPVTSPITPRGAWVFGLGVGSRRAHPVFGGLPEGVMYAILLMNAVDAAHQPLHAAKPFGTTAEPTREKTSDGCAVRSPARISLAARDSSAALTLGVAGLPLADCCRQRLRSRWRHRGQPGRAHCAGGLQGPARPPRCKHSSGARAAARRRETPKAPEPWPSTPATTGAAPRGLRHRRRGGGLPGHHPAHLRLRPATARASSA